ncbi:hypothetical protein J6590_039972 [Homalodisca vitripennis]|nr:hypothetical protein J6590_039972 [Homalodisca vitripennis]
MQPQNVVKDLRVLGFHRTTLDDLEARLVWSASPGRFQVRWAPHSSCSCIKNNPTYQAITEAFQYNIDHLVFNCKYQVIVNAISSSKSARFTFTTPLCTQVNSKLPC